MGFWARGKADVETRLEKLQADVAGLGRSLRETQELLEELHAKHLRLRGTVYSYRLHKPADDDEPAPRTAKEAKAETKDELRRRLFHSGRIVPGKPTVHGESPVEE